MGGLAAGWRFMVSTELCILEVTLLHETLEGNPQAQVSRGKSVTW